MKLSLRIGSDKITLSDLRRLYRDEERRLYDPPFLDDLLLKLKYGYEDAQQAFVEKAQEYDKWNAAQAEAQTTQDVEGFDRDQLRDLVTKPPLWESDVVLRERNAIDEARGRIAMVLHMIDRGLGAQDPGGKAAVVNAVLGHTHYNMRMLRDQPDRYPEEVFAYWPYVLSGDAQEILAYLDSTHEPRNVSWRTYKKPSSLNLRRKAQDEDADTPIEGHFILKIRIVRDGGGYDHAIASALAERITFEVGGLAGDPPTPPTAQVAFGHEETRHEAFELAQYSILNNPEIYGILEYLYVVGNETQGFRITSHETDRRWDSRSDPPPPPYQPLIEGGILNLRKEAQQHTYEYEVNVTVGIPEGYAESVAVDVILDELLEFFLEYGGDEVITETGETYGMTAPTGKFISYRFSHLEDAQTAFEGVKDFLQDHEAKAHIQRTMLDAEGDTVAMSREAEWQSPSFGIGQEEDYEPLIEEE